MLKEMMLSMWIVLGFLAASWVAGREPGETGKIRPRRLKFRDYVVHLHHWLWATILLVISYRFFQGHPWSYETACYGFLIGLILQGLTYSDFHRFVYRRAEVYDEADQEQYQ